MIAEESGTLEMVAEIQYICTLVRGEALCQFDTLPDDIKSTTPLTVEAIIWDWLRNFYLLICY